MPQDEYYIVFDTNVLYASYNNHSDFTAFSFNSAFDNVVGFVETLDMYAHITILIPDVVYEEMKRQKISAHNEKRGNLIKSIEKSKFPGFSYEMTKIDYDKYISDKITEYQEELASGQVIVAKLPLPTEKRFTSIMNRAFAKKPPFLGAEKESDKGFKDALLWESILEFKKNVPQSKLIFYSKDNGFCSELADEFQEIFNDQIFICKNENEVEEQLKKWAKIFDKYVYIPEKLSKEEFDFKFESPFAAPLAKKVDELAAQGNVSSVEDIEERFAATTGKVVSEDDV